MGQYYKPAILGKNKKTVINWMYSHDYNNGLKLMEHSYIGNDFVAAFETLITNNPQRMVWGGDYAAECKGLKTNVYSRCTDKTKVNPVAPAKDKQPRFIVNHTTKQFVDKTKAPKDGDGWQVHPLPLLTCEGNGQGGGDYRREDNKSIGIWARDIISLENEVPEGFKELLPNFLMD